MEHRNLIVRIVIADAGLCQLADKAANMPGDGDEGSAYVDRLLTPPRNPKLTLAQQCKEIQVR